MFGDSYDQNYPHFGANFGKIGKDQFIFHCIKIILIMRLVLMLELRYLEGGVEVKLKDLFQFLQEENTEHSEINYKLFPQLDYSEFQSFILRNSGQDWLRTSVKDAALTKFS